MSKNFMQNIMELNVNEKVSAILLFLLYVTYTILRITVLGEGPPKPPRDPTRTSNQDVRQLGRKEGDGSPARSSDRRRDGGGTVSDGEGAGLARKQPRRRESHSRRHTLQNGIDYGLVRTKNFNVFCFVFLNSTYKNIFFSSRE